MAAKSKNRPIIGGGRSVWKTSFLRTPDRVARRNAASAAVTATKGAKATAKKR